MMKYFSNGDVFLLPLQPHHNKYVLAKYINYQLYFPWLRTNANIFLVYDFFSDKPFLPKVPDLGNIPLFCQPLPALPSLASKEMILVLNDPPEFSEDVPHLVFKDDKIFHDQLMGVNPLNAEYPLSVGLFYTKLGYTSYAKFPIENVDDKLEFSTCYTSNHMKYRVSLQLFKEEGIPLERIFDGISDELELKAARRAYKLVELCVPVAEPSSQGHAALYDFSEEDPDNKFLAKFLDHDMVILYSFSLVHSYAKSFERFSVQPNSSGWKMFIEHLLSLGPEIGLPKGFQCDIVDDKTVVSMYFGTIAQLEYFYDFLNERISDPSKVETHLANISIDVKEKYFPSKPIDQHDPEDLEIKYSEIEGQFDNLQVFRYQHSKRVEFHIVLAVNDLYTRYNDLFEDYDSYANGYGWESFLIEAFFPDKKEDGDDKIYPIFNPEAAGLTIIFRRKGICLQMAEEIDALVAEPELVMQVLKK